MKSLEELRLQGFSVSEGVAVGSLFLLPDPVENSVLEFSIAKSHLEFEIKRYYIALQKSKEDLLFLQLNLKKEQSLEALEIIDTHIQMLDDPLLTLQIEEKIRSTQKNAESVFSSVVREYEKKFSKIKDPFFQQRIVDVLDVSKRVLDHLEGKNKVNFADIPQGAIIFTRELCPSHIATLQAARIGAVVTQYGGGSSHAALIARAKGIPYVSNIDIDLFRDIGNSWVIVDGKSGEVIVHPMKETLQAYQKLNDQIKIDHESLQHDLVPVIETIDGYPIEVHANVGNLMDLEEMHLYRPHGVGLFRSEYLFLEKNTVFLSEEEQLNAYRKVAEKTQGLTLVVRVFDIGGDKNPDAFLENEKEANPVLGCRGIRYLLRHPAVFRTQLKAIMRAFQSLDFKILLPLISDPQEIIEAKKMIQSVQKELEEQGLVKLRPFQLGCMIEVPSAAFLCDVIAKEVDFLSIGTNDLVQYTLGMDRSNPMMQDFFTPTHPSVIRMIKMIVMEAKAQGKPVTICGEMASSPLFVPLLLGLGLNQFSCSPRHIPLVKRAVRQSSLVECFKVAQKVLQMGSHLEISRLLSEISHHKVSQELV